MFYVSEAHAALLIKKKERSSSQNNPEQHVGICSSHFKARGNGYYRGWPRQPVRKTVLSKVYQCGQTVAAHDENEAYCGQVYHFSRVRSACFFLGTGRPRALHWASMQASRATRKLTWRAE